jgi:hypothetical protein
MATVIAAFVLIVPPLASCTVTTGCAAHADPPVPPPGCVVNTSRPPFTLTAGLALAVFDPSLVSYARHLDQEIAESEDGAEGPAAFRERRKPVWKMR